MNELISDTLKTILAILLVIVITHTVFFMAYGYLAGGDAFIALENFYNIMYR